MIEWDKVNAHIRRHPDLQLNIVQAKLEQAAIVCLQKPSNNYFVPVAPEELLVLIRASRGEGPAKEGTT